MATPADFELSVETASALEFPSLLKLIARWTASDLGHHRLSGLRPMADESAWRRHRQGYDEAARLLAARPLVPLCEQPFGPLLEAVGDGGRGLSGRDLVEIRSLLRISADAIERLGDQDPPCERLAALTAEIPDTAEIRRSLEQTFDARGEIRENASPRLAELRKRLRSVRQDLYDRLRHLAGEHREHLSEETVPMRGGRLVLMLQAGARGRVQGLIHGRSGRGKSFYFEPLETVEKNNQLQQAGEEAEAEKRRILAALIRRLCAELDSLRSHADLVAELDTLQAMVRFAHNSGGRMADLAPRHQLELREARHPLLDPLLEDLRREALGTPGHTTPIVPLNLELTAERRVLVVTGPNAGGKTVALKTLGLLALAHQSGLPIPAARGTRLPLFSGIVATVGDDQDLLADRSTFSGRLLRLREAWQASGPDALILLDELGSGTDPDEGAALSTAILEGLLARRSLVLITTHLSQVAVRALEAEGAFCAAMLFDAESGPTFRLMPGPPGGSEALALARRVGLPQSWLDRAEELLGSEHRDLRRLLAEVERTRLELAETHRCLQMELDDAALLRRRLAEREADLAAERKTLSKTLQRQLDGFRDEISRRIGDEVERLRSEVEHGRRRGLVEPSVERLFAEAPSFHEEDGGAGAVEIGGLVRHRRLGWTGTVAKLERGRVTVRASGKSLRCRVEDLVAVAAESAGGSPSKKRYRPPVSAAVRTPDMDLGEAGKVRELHLIGERVEPALESLDRFLDQALLASRPAVRIVHGHGSGRLRAAVRKHLRNHPAVAAQRPGRADEGGDGATVVELAGG
ncbi:MAG: Smr/MutS family protein [Thermoanaerobaculia bacterium]